MSWARLEDSFPDHPKVAALSDTEFRLHVTAICYASRYHTDGHIPAAAIRVLRGTPKTADQLVRAGVWETAGDGWMIHDFLDYNPSRDEALAKRATRAEAGRLGGQRSGQTRRSKTEANASRLLEASASRLLEAKSNPDPSPLLLKKQTRAHARDGGDEDFQQAVAALDALKVKLNPMVQDEIGMLLEEGAKPEWFREAVSIAARNGASSWGYIRKILLSWGPDGPPAAVPRTPAKPADGYREPPPPHIDAVLEAIKNRPHREPRDPGEDALLADMKANNPAAYEAEMDLRRRAHERAMST